MTTVTFADGCLSVTDARVFRTTRRRLAESLRRELTSLPGVLGATLDLEHGDCRVLWDASHTSPETVAPAFIKALEAARRDERRSRRWMRWWPRRRAAATDPPPLVAASPPEPAILVRGPRRALYIAAGGGCVALTLVGAVVPGIPTVPFLLASSYLLARSSPTLHRILTNTPIFGTIVTEWDAHRALSRRSKRTLIGLVVIVVGVSVSLAKVEPTVLLIVGVVVTGSIYGISRIPEFPSPAPAGLLGMPALIAVWSTTTAATISSRAVVVNGG